MIWVVGWPDNFCLECQNGFYDSEHESYITYLDYNSTQMNELRGWAASSSAPILAPFTPLGWRLL